MPNRMTAKWSSEYVVAEHKDLQASTMAVDSSGQYILLAGRRCLAIVDVDNPTFVIKKFPRQSKWEVGSAEWNPHSHYSNLCAISSNQRTEILSWNAIDLTPINCLRFHTRAVSDLNWHHFEPALLASCSVDTYINIWDVRDPRKPCVSLSAVVGATQVRWNRVTGNLLATAHEGDVRLWDWRKGSSPVQYIAAHLQKIHGLDWSANQDYQLATSSQDCTVKFFDVNNPRMPENALRTVSPVWRARFTPFGEGMMTTQLRRGENSLLLWRLSDLSNPVHSFLGNNDLVLEFDWKSPRSDDDDYQLITWSKDQSLRIWRVDINLQKLCGYEPDNQPQIVYEESESTFNVLTIDAVPSKSDKEIEMGLEVVEETYMDLHRSLAPTLIVPDSLRIAGHKSVAASIAAAQAVLTNTLSPTSHRKKKSAINNNVGIEAHAQPEHYSFSKEVDQIKSLGSISNDNSISVCDVDEVQRCLTAVIRTAKHQVVLHISLPSSYPDGVIPNFLIGKGTTLDANGRCRITKVLKQTATISCRKGHPSLELALQQLLSTLDQLTPVDKSETESTKIMVLPVSSSTAGNNPFRLPQTGLGHPGFLQSAGLFGTLTHHQDLNIPYPRSSGARFCSTGMLICFGRPSYLRRIHNKTFDASATPRSLSVNQAYSSSLAPHNMTTPSNAAPYGILYPPVAQSPTGDPSVSISSFYNQDRRQKSRTSKTKNRLPSYSSSSEENKRGTHETRHHKVVGVVTIYDASGLMPLQLELAERYVFSDTDTVWMCNQNAAVASQFGRKDLAYIWSLGALLATPTLVNDNRSQDLETPWAQNPFGRKLLHAIIDHYVKLRDIQTVAMLCCAFGYKCESQDVFRRKTTRSESGSRNLRWGLKPGDSPYHTIHPGDTTLDGWNLVTGLKQIRSNSWSDSLDDFRLGTPGMNPISNGRPLPVTSIFLPHSTTSALSSNGIEGSGECRDKDLRLLDPKFSGLFDNYRRCYADILYRWGLLEARVLVLKYLSSPIDPHRGVDFVTECNPCRTTARGPQCTVCKRLLLNCVICRVVVKGSASFCLVCGHGGHGRCMANWFAEENECPSGCACNCLLENNTVFSV
ncbi:GATOR complex protein WDR59-like isoform X2 [Daphnia carinata]|uniref:GATOR complex protein WDR59-like isoform X2 n=1 Tax=Daphnia carinata TaxID=120202 RepID=UPI002868ED6A|nr:GATOR complex protein WDR59-like isoform X2 [Daphnia carinata]